MRKHRRRGTPRVQPAYFHVPVGRLAQIILNRFRRLTGRTYHSAARANPLVLGRAQTGAFEMSPGGATHITQCDVPSSPANKLPSCEMTDKTPETEKHRREQTSVTETLFSAQNFRRSELLFSCQWSKTEHTNQTRPFR